MSASVEEGGRKAGEEEQQQQERKRLYSLSKGSSSGPEVASVLGLLKYTRTARALTMFYW